MRKAFDIMPPRYRSGMQDSDVPAPKVEHDFSTLEVGSHDWHAWHAEAKAPVKTQTRLKIAGTIFLFIRQAGIYLIVGMISFIFFSALFYGYNVYQDRQRDAAALEAGGVAGTTTTISTENISLRVLNGSGRFEQLNALRDALQAKGYVVRASGNAAQPSERTIIYYKANKAEAALQLASDIGQFAPSLEKNDELTAVDDIVILLGSLPYLGTP